MAYCPPAPPPLPAPQPYTAGYTASLLQFVLLNKQKTKCKKKLYSLAASAAARCRRYYHCTSLSTYRVVTMDGHLDTSSMQSYAIQHSSVGPRHKRMRRCASTPTLSSCSTDLDNSGLEVYVAFRPFTEFGGDLFAKLPSSVKDNLLGLGVAHYMTVFRTPDGRYTQFDFGPTGGRDIYVSAGSLDKLRALDQPKKSGKRSVPGEVRENQVAPSSRIFDMHFIKA